MTAHRLIRLVCVLACVTAATTTLACGEAPATPLTPTPTPNTPAAPGAIELTGLIVGDDGRPVTNTPVYVNFGLPAVKGMTDDTGRYQVRFGPAEGYSPGNTVELLVTGEGYEIERRFFRPTGSSQTVDLRPRAIRWITAGESISVTVAPGDPECRNNVQDMPGFKPSYVCRPVRFLALADGVLTAEAVSAGSGPSRPLLEMEATSGPDDCCYLGNPLTFSVAAGMVVKINVEIPEGAPSQTFTLTTTLR